MAHRDRRIPSQRPGIEMANRSYASNMYRTITLEDFKRGPVRICDDLKTDAELREIFARVSFADPSTAQQLGNHDANVVPLITPSTASVEFAIAHNLGRVPVGFFPVVPTIANYGTADLTVTRAPDTTNLYLKSATTSKSLAIIVW